VPLGSQRQSRGQTDGVRAPAINFVAYVVVAVIALLLFDNLIGALLVGGLAATVSAVLQRQRRS
jgi:hypothetical protein